MDSGVEGNVVEMEEFPAVYHVYVRTLFKERVEELCLKNVWKNGKNRRVGRKMRWWNCVRGMRMVKVGRGEVADEN